MIDYNLLAYGPSKENIGESSIHIFADIKDIKAENRFPTLEEFKELLEEHDYKIAEEDNGENNFSFRVAEPYSLFEHEIMSVSFFQKEGNVECISLSDCSFQVVFELALLLCKKYGPYYLGYNGFNEIFLIDENTTADQLKSPPSEKEAKEEREMEKVRLENIRIEGMREEILLDAAEPNRKKLPTENRYARSSVMLSDIFEETLVAQKCVRRGHSFFKVEEDGIKSICPLYLFSTSVDTFFIQVRFDFLDKKKYVDAGIKIPPFPANVYYDKMRIFPEREDVKRWHYKHVTARHVTDVEWMLRNKEYVLSLGEGWLEMAEEYFQEWKSEMSK